MRSWIFFEGESNPLLRVGEAIVFDFLGEGELPFFKGEPARRDLRGLPFEGDSP